MKIAIVGAGGVGGYFGGRLAQSGHDVTLIARGEHLQAINERGLAVDTPDKSFHVSEIKATDKPEEVGEVDAIIVAVKGWQVQEAAELVKPLLGEHTLVLPLLNGVDATGILSEALGSDKILNGLCGIIAKKDGPGRIQHVGIDPFIKLGCSDDSVSPQLLELKGALVSTGADVEIPDDINRAMWLKYIFIAPLSGVTAVTRSTSGSIRSIPETRKMLHDAIAETIEVGKSLRVNLDDKDLQDTIKLIDGIPEDGTTSMQRDIESGYPSELETQIGTIVALGREHNISIPVNNLIYAALLPQEKLARSG